MRLWICLIAACGRLGFDPSAERQAADATVDDAEIDAMLPPTGMIYVPPDTFDFAPGTPWKRATVTRGFYMDRDEVTVGRFAMWLAAGRPVPCDGCALDAAYPMHWYAAWNANVQATDFTQPCSSPWMTNGSTFPTADAAMPMNCLTWTQAIAFCAWDGKRLPTDVEWNLEARGGDHRSYAWGDTVPDCDHATYKGCPFPARAGTATAGGSKHGALDLSGSLWEWTWDATSQIGLAPSAGDVPDDSVDFSGLDLGSGDADNHVITGGEWGEDIADLSLIAGDLHAPGIGWGGQTPITTTGVRCVKSL